MRVMLDYVDHVNICWKLEAALKEQELWPDINSILSKYLTDLKQQTNCSGTGTFLLVLF